MNDEFKILNDREHILLRPDMYIGSIELSTQPKWIINNNKFEFQEVQYSPGLLKIINEILDNAVDELIKSANSSSKITIDISSTKVSIQDNGRGIPIVKKGDHYLPFIAWSSARSGTNFNDNSKVIGKNGVGSFLTNVYSKIFTGTTVNSGKQYTVEFINKGSNWNFTESISKNNSKPFTKVEFYPDLERFGLTEISDIHINLLKFRVLNLAFLYPEIKFLFNNEKIIVKNFLNYFDTKGEFIASKDDNNILIGILPNFEDTPKIYSYINGLEINSGTHIEYILNKISDSVKDKFKKFNLKTSDIKSKLNIVFMGRNFLNIKNNSQLKTDISNSNKEISDYLKDIDLDKFISRILKNKEITDNILEYYKLKEEFLSRKNLDKLEKSKVKIRDSKYLPATKSKEFLFVCEGDSAKNSLASLLGRTNSGYFQVQGVPLNCLEKDIINNKELSNLYSVIKNEEYNKIVIATDADLDGYHITFLLLIFFYMYLLDELNKGKIKILKTPIAIEYGKKSEIVNVIYDYSDLKNSTNNYVKYFKGLGSWDEGELTKDILKIEDFEFNSEEELKKYLELWGKKDLTDERKKYIIEYKGNFDSNSI